MTTLQDKRMIYKLSKLYPNGIVEGLRRDHYSLYQMIFAAGKKKGMNHKEYLEYLGFDYEDNRLVDESVIKSRLKKLYPNKVVEGLTTKNPSLYQSLINCASRQDVQVQEYVESLGFKYKDKRVSDSLSKFKEKLLELYPDKKVNNFQEHHRLYIKVYRTAKSKNMTVSDYLHELGFDYESTKKPNKDLLSEKITKTLLELYPDKVVENLSINHDKLYKKIQKICHKYNYEIGEYLNMLGFDYVGGRKVERKSQKELFAAQ